MTLKEIILNLILGLVSGCVSGYLTSLYFKKNEEETRWENDLKDDQQTMTRYIDMICWELEQLMEGDGRETRELQKLLISPPRFKSFSDLKKIKPEHQTFTRDAYGLFAEINNYLKYDLPSEAYEIPKLVYLKFQTKLRRVQWNILLINKNEIERADLVSANIKESHT